MRFGMTNNQEIQKIKEILQQNSIEQSAVNFQTLLIMSSEEPKSGLNLICISNNCCCFLNKSEQLTVKFCRLISF